MTSRDISIEKKIVNTTLTISSITEEKVDLVRNSVVYICKGTNLKVRDAINAIFIQESGTSLEITGKGWNIEIINGKTEKEVREIFSRKAGEKRESFIKNSLKIISTGT